MVGEMGIIKEALKAFKTIVREIDKGSSEFGVRRSFDELFLRGVLGYERKDVRWEKKRADLTIIDENDFAIIKIETKKPTENIDRKQYEEQAFKYAEETTKYIGLTNFFRLKIWEIQGTERKLRVNLDFSRIVGKGKLMEYLTSKEKSQILFLENLSKEVIFNPSKYEKFNETYARIDITKETGFEKLLERLNLITNVLLLGYTLRTFEEYKDGYTRYKNELEEIEKEFLGNKKRDLNQNLAKYKQLLGDKYRKYLPFSGFYLWKQYSGKEGVLDDKVKEVFCKETLYVFLNKLLFLRICEDKGFLEKSISNGGIEQLRGFLRRRFDADVINKEILELAFKSASGLYSHFYETGILDWFRSGDGDLNAILSRILWILNQFDFTHVDRDILGNLYEKYLPNKERKRLGEFYTPVEVIDYILTTVGYTFNHSIESKSLLDPACGSGGFLVRATRRLIARFLVKFGKVDKNELRDPKNWKEIISRLSSDEARIILETIQEHIHGLDINPFACHIAEMNLLFQTIDLYQKLSEKYKGYKLRRFKIYRTDSLEKETQKQIWDYIHRTFLEEQEEIRKIKNRRFDFVVGNPPYVRVQLLDKQTRKYLTENYETAFSNFDLYVVFIERGLSWLNRDGKIGYITSNQFVNREYGKKIRKYILENSEIMSMVDFARTKVFQDVTNYPIIIILKRGKSTKNRFKFVRVKKEKPDLIQDIFLHLKEKEHHSQYFDIFQVIQNELKDPWQFSPKKESRLLNRIDNIGTRLGDISNILLGIQTGKDSLLIGKIAKKVSKKVVQFASREDRAQVEQALLKPLLRGREVRKWILNFSGSYVLCPHHSKNGRFQPIAEKELRRKWTDTYNFLKNNERKIRNRQWFGKNAEQSQEIRYSLMYYEQAKFFDSAKILTPALTNKNNFTIDENGYFFVLGTAGVYGIIPDDTVNINYLLGILNSKVSEFYLMSICPIKQGGYFQYSKKYLERLPIKLPKTSREKQIANMIIEKVDEILKLYKKRTMNIDEILKDKEVIKLYSIPAVSFFIKDDARFKSISAKGNKVFINSKDYIHIKDKRLRNFVVVYLNCIREKMNKKDDIKNLIYNLRIPKSNQIVNEIIKKGGFRQVTIEEESRKLEQELNNLVYRIYKLSDEEIGVIEESQ